MLSKVADKPFDLKLYLSLSFLWWPCCSSILPRYNSRPACSMLARFSLIRQRVACASSVAIFFLTHLSFVLFRPIHWPVTWSDCIEWQAFCAINVVAFLCSGFQICDLAYHLMTGKRTSLHRFHCYLDFYVDQVNTFSCLLWCYPYEFLHLKCFAQRSSHDSCNKSDSILVSFQVASHISIWGKHKSFIYFIEKLTSCHLFTNVGKFAHSCLTIDAFSVYTSSDFSSMNETLFALTELSGPFILSNICTCLQQPVGLVIGSQTGGRDKLTPIKMARDSASHVPFAISSPIFHFAFERHFIFPDLSYILNVMVSCMPQR